MELKDYVQENTFSEQMPSNDIEESESEPEEVEEPEIVETEE